MAKPISLSLACAAVAMCACRSDDALVCDAPEQATHSCEPITDPALGCIGGPMWTPQNPRTVDGGVWQEYPETIFPAGCLVIVPECGCCYTSGRSFVCGCYGAQCSWGELL